MKVAIVLAAVFLLQVTNAFPKSEEMFQDPDGHMYKIEMGRDGEEKVTRDDADDKEVTIALHELGKWVVLLEYDNKTCYVIDMTEEEIHMKAKETDFAAGDYDVKYMEGEEQTEIIATCEKHGGKGRSIVHLGPKDETSQPSSMQYLHGANRGGIQKRSYCLGLCYRVYRVCYIGRCFIYVRYYYCIRYC